MKRSIWIHDHEILFEFMTWIQIWSHYHEKYSESYQNSYIWIGPRIQAAEFIYMKSYMNSCYDFTHELSDMKNIVKSWLNSYNWIHIEIMVEFINFEWIWIQLQFFPVRKQILLISKMF